MDKAAIIRVQQRLQVRVDGVFGPASLAALFARAGAMPVMAAELALAGALRLFGYGLMDTPLRCAHFLAQLAHESGGFRWMEELASGDAYEGRNDLGNAEPGDGRRYKGRGPIQLTGRANYRKFGRLIGIDLERHPEIAAIPSIGLWTACVYWDVNFLNALADRDDIDGITRRINGGLNGLQDRKERLKVMKGVLL